MQALDAILNRHGVLRFRPTPVERDKIELVLRAAVAAPSPANSQPWAFVAVTRPDLARQVAEYLVRTQQEQVFGRLLETPPAFVAQLMHLYDEFCDVPCFIVLCRQRRAELAPAGLSSVVRDWELCSLGAAMANLMTAATTLGLGTRWFGNPMMAPGPLREMLAVPEEVEIVAVTPLGYHDEPAKERPVQPLAAHTRFQRGDKYALAALLQGKLGLGDVAHLDRFGECWEAS